MVLPPRVKPIMGNLALTTQCISLLDHPTIVGVQESVLRSYQYTTIRLGGITAQKTGFILGRDYNIYWEQTACLRR